MLLKTIKEKNENKEYNKLIIRISNLIKSTLNLGSDEQLFFLCWFRYRIVLLYNSTVIIAYGEDNKSYLGWEKLSELYTVELLKPYPKKTDEIKIGTIIDKNNKNWFNAKIFLDWIDEPSEINNRIDEPYYKIIEYLQKYNKNTFSDGRYDFYSKSGEDFSYINNFYAYDKKNNTELRLFIPDKWVQSNNEWKIIEPQKPSNITIEDLSGKLSNYQKLQCKKAFLKIANEINPDFNIKNYWVMELIKHTIQPIDELLEWSCHRCFCKPDKFSNIWVPDFLKANEKPYFL